MTIKFKPGIDDLPEYVAGKTIDEIKTKYNLKEVHKLASNENIFGPCNQVKDLIKNYSEEINYYPDSEAREIRQKISDKFKISPENIIMGNGTDQIIEMICDSFINPCGQCDNIVIADPNFLIYEKATLKCGGSIKKVPLNNFRQDIKAMLDSVDSSTRLFFLASPHNPSGSNITKAEFLYTLKNLRKDVLLVLDEAYYEYLPESDDIGSIASIFKFENLIVLRTFSKIYGLAGLRIGYGIANKEIISGLNKIRLPFNVSSIAQKAAATALENRLYIEDIREKILREKEKFYGVLKNNGIEYVKSYSNFILIKTGSKSLEIAEELLKKGFIIRPGENLGIKGYIRVTISKPEINDEFLEAFTKIYKRL
ncbi:MAG: histidinol-phosphate transaminase [Actinobacteria bacterium]|nr:histidinol-phosphate transaminase [Actinomycetota bacterium]